MVKNKCSINGKYNKWIVKYDGNDKQQSIKKNISIHPATNEKKKLINYYDEDGQNINKLVDADSNADDVNYNWMYETPTNDKLPQQ